MTHYRLQVYDAAGLAGVEYMDVADDEEAIIWSGIIRNFYDDMKIVKWRLWDMHGDEPVLVEQSGKPERWAHEAADE